MNKIDISTEEKKQEVYKIFESFENKTQIHKYYKISDNTQGSEYIKQIANEIGFDFNVYKERKRKFCLHCGKEIIGKGKSSKKFCNSSCAASYNNRKRGEHSEETKMKISQSLTKNDKQKPHKTLETSREKYCLHCNKKLDGRKTKFCSKKCRNDYYYQRTHFKSICSICGKEFFSLKKEQQFCSPNCYKQFQREKLLNEWLNNGYNFPTKILLCIRKYLYKSRNYKCEICGFEGYNKKTGNTILQIHHIDGDSTNNTKNNLQVLCPNCHAMTENFMALNVGKSTRINRCKKNN